MYAGCGSLGFCGSSVGGGGTSFALFQQAMALRRMVATLIL
jgi:hypothetical protein